MCPHCGGCGDSRYLTEFQSHEPEFDYLKSLEIEEKINQVRWCHSCNSQLLLSTNDKTIKLWRVRRPSTLQETPDVLSTDWQAQPRHSVLGFGLLEMDRAASWQCG